MKLDFNFHGKWLIRYEPAEFTYLEILTLLPTLQTSLEQQKLNYEFLNINFNRTIPRNSYFPVGNHLFIRNNGSDGQLIETDPGALAMQITLEPLPRPIHSVNLLFPHLESDPRWKTIGLPAGHLFLASGLTANNFNVTTMPMILPATKSPPVALEADLVGLTLFEDLLPALRPFLARFRAVYGGWLAAGGPFPTLAPLAAIYHLPQINLFVRGEAEQVLPDILLALNRGDLQSLFCQAGFFWQQPGLIVMSDFKQINHPQTFSRLMVNLDFLRPEHVRHGLEINFSRGCRRGCVFCCHAQGKKFRKLPLEKIEELLIKYNAKITEFSLAGNTVHTANINDDDILQEPAFATAVFFRLKKHGFRIHGIQTSPASLIHGRALINYSALDLATDPDLFINSQPLIWLGTDVFINVRAFRLGKVLPSPSGFFKLLGEFEKRHIRHYHYWISSDGQSNWNEFIDEFVLICIFYRDFPNFSLLAHAPFIVPYQTSRLFQGLPAVAPNLKIKEILSAPDPLFSYVLPERLETSFPNLNRLLSNEKAGGEAGFFDFLKDKDFQAAAQLAYHFLKQEQLQTEKSDAGLGRAQKRLEKVISELLDLRDA